MDLRNIQLQQAEQGGRGISLSHQLFLSLRQKILARQLPADSRLPASRVLAGDLKVSRNTVNSAYEQLRAEGYVNSLKGSGFYISSTLPQPDISPEPVSSNIIHQWPPLSSYGDRLLQSPRQKRSLDNLPFTPDLPDFKLFPQKIWQQLWGVTI